MILKSKQLSVLLLLILLPAGLIGQRRDRPPMGPLIKFGIHADPVISWFSSDMDSVRNDGARSGFNFGISLYRYFGPNYAVSTGINIISAGGRLVSDRTSQFNLSQNKDYNVAAVPAKEAIVYKIQYLSIPIGLKLQTNQIGYITVFTDFGVDPKLVVGKKVDIPSNRINNQKAPEEVKNFNISYHIMAGIEYAIGGNTEIVLGVGFDNNFADITRDLEDDPYNQFIDKISHKMISIRLGINF